MKDFTHVDTIYTKRLKTVVLRINQTILADPERTV